ncbi:MAG: AAA family ATPase, partial [Inquilinus sp.]|nr:AAA family ATPase [Inquilinus sp.]
MNALLGRVAEALERLAPRPEPPADLAAADAFTWHAEGDRLM